MLRSLISAFLILISLSRAFPQEKGSDPVSPGERLTAWLEEMAAYGESEYMVSDFASEIGDLLARPVMLNRGTEEEISRLFFLTWYQQQSLTDYIRRMGSIVSVNEIAYLPGFDRELAQLLEPFVSLAASSSKEVSSYTSTRVAAGYIFSQSYISDNTPGPPWKTYLRGETGNKKVRAGFTTEKDQGEPLLYNGFMPDYLSGYITLNTGGYISNITTGDFRVRFGQGLTSWTGYQAGISALAPLQIKGKASISPYRSTNENNFFRGVGITAGKENHTILAYLSVNRIDATTEQDENREEEVITSFYTAGLHNSETTLAKRDRVTASSAGISYSVNGKRLRTGLSATASHFSMPVAGTGESYDIYDFSGTTNIALAADHSLSLNKTIIYGEAAWNPGGGFAIIQGAGFIPAPGSSLNVMYTNIMKGYNSFNGMAAGRQTVNNFREMITLSFSFEPAPYVTVATGLLRRRDNWYGQWGSPPLATTRYESEIRYNPSARTALSVSIRTRELTKSSSVERGVRTVSETKYTNLRINLSLKPAGSLSLHTRAEFIRSGDGKDHGYLFLQGLRYTLPFLPVTIIPRVSVWSTSGYDTRIYAWEDDLLYSNTITPFYNSGYRSYVLVSAGESSKIILRLRAGFTHMEVPGVSERDNAEFRVEVRCRL